MHWNVLLAHGWLPRRRIEEVLMDEPQTYEVESGSILLPLAIGVRQDKAVCEGLLFWFHAQPSCKLKSSYHPSEPVEDETLCFCRRPADWDP